MNSSSEDEKPKNTRKSHSVSTKKNFIKVKRKTKKKRLVFDQLSFVEPHVDTFYCFNEVQSACNPMTAKLIEPDEEIVKEWIHPDTQLVKPRQQTIKIENSLKKNMFRPLEFVNDDLANVCSKTPKKKADVKNLFEEINETIRRSELTIVSPSSHRIFINDTPVQYYGMPAIERRKRGLEC